MKNTQYNAIVNVAMWLATGAAVCVAVFLTSRIAPLWFFLIPLFGGPLNSMTHKAGSDE